MDWAKRLGELGLESPGREEAVRDTLELIQKRKQMEAARQEAKAKGSRRKKR